MTDIETLDRKIKALAAKHGIDMESDAFEIAVLLNQSARQMTTALFEGVAREGADACAELGDALHDARDALRCAECTCEAGGVDCNWIKPGPAVDVTAMEDPAPVGLPPFSATAVEPDCSTGWCPAWTMADGRLRIVEWDRHRTKESATARAQEILDAGFGQHPDNPAFCTDL